MGRLEQKPLQQRTTHDDKSKKHECRLDAFSLTIALWYTLIKHLIKYMFFLIVKLLDLYKETFVSWNAKTNYCCFSLQSSQNQRNAIRISRNYSFVHVTCQTFSYSEEIPFASHLIGKAEITFDTFFQYEFCKRENVTLSTHVPLPIKEVTNASRN